MFSQTEFFLQKFTFSIVNRNRRQWTVEHLHATAGDLLWLSFENFHKCSNNNPMSKALRSADFRGLSSKLYSRVGKHLLFSSSTITASDAMWPTLPKNCVEWPIEWSFSITQRTCERLRWYNMNPKIPNILTPDNLTTTRGKQITTMAVQLHRVSKKLCIFVFVRTVVSAVD